MLPTIHLLHHPFFGTIPLLPQPQLPRIPPPTLKVLPKLDIFSRDRILTNMRQTKQHQERTQNAQTTRNIERILRRGILIISRGLNVRKHVCPDKSADFANCSRDSVVLAADAGGAGFGGDEPDVVAGAEFAEGEEDAVDDDESADVAGLGEVRVEAGHDEADEGLEGDADGEGVAGSDPVGEEGSKHGAGNVEKIDDGVPTEGLRKGSRFGEDIGENRR